jgi:purine-binding chemotaxis protein CheW
MADIVTDAATEPDRDGTRSYVVFRLGGEGYALEVMRVQEVLDVQSMTEVPGSPACLLGVINLRGHVVPVYDLRIPFGLNTDSNRNRTTSVLIVETEQGHSSQVTGLVVDRVSDVLEFATEEVQASPQLGLGKTTPFVRGLIRHQEGFLLVLDLDRVFSALASLNGEGV